jgi:hypothetical protein
MLRQYAPQSNPPTGSDIPSTGTWAQVAKTHIPTTTPPPQQSTVIHSPAPDPLFHQMCEQLNKMSLKLEKLEATVAAQRDLLNKPPSPGPFPPDHSPTPAPAPDENQFTQAMSTLIITLDLLEKRVHDKIPQAADTNLAAQFTAFLQLYHHDMAKLRNQFQENISPTSTSSSRKKTKQDVHQPTSPSSLRPGDTPDQGIHQDDDP